VTSGGAKEGRGRMAAHIAGGARLPSALAGGAAPAPATATPAPGLRHGGALVALAFGQLQSQTLKYCPQAHAETRGLAAALAPSIGADAQLHVSGCAKGCAYRGASSITLVGTDDGFDLVRGGGTRDVPAMHGLDPARLCADPAALLGAA
jgi:precorrin-3B synthase